MNTFQVKSDGSASCTMSCPVPTCSRKFTVLFKAYNKKRDRDECSSAPKWYFSNVKKHLLQNHCFDAVTDVLSGFPNDKQIDPGTSVGYQANGDVRECDSEHHIPDNHEESTPTSSDGIEFQSGTDFCF